MLKLWLGEFLLAKKSKGKTKSLDLHGKTVDEVFDAVDRFLLKESKTGAPTVRILPGKGSGKVRAELEKYLKLSGYQWSFEKLAGGKDNIGAFIIHMN